MAGSGGGVLAGGREEQVRRGKSFIGDSWLDSRAGIRDTCAGDEVGPVRGRAAAWRPSFSGDPTQLPRGTCTG